MLKNFCLARFNQFKGITAAIATVGLIVPSLSLIASTTAVAQTMSLAPDNLPRSVMGTAGGRTAIPGAIVPGGRGTPSASCLGFASASPDHEFQFSDAPGRLTFTVDSFGPSVDTTLAIKTPDGHWLCGDDISSTDKDATITVTGAAAGKYQVWVGTFDGNYEDYELRLN